MQSHHCGLDNLVLDASVITIGSFDGVHQGHQYIFDRLTAYSKSHSIPSVVITFFPHPIIVLRDIKDPYYLTLPDERASLLLKLGIDHVVTIPFTRGLSNLTPYEFMDWLNQHIPIKHLIVGEDFALGKDRKGSAEELKEIGQSLGYDLEIVFFKENEQNRVSSSRIRQLLKEGKIEAANSLIGRPYKIPVQISSIVKSRMGSSEIIQLEMTCNPMQLLPAQGLYNAMLETELTVQYPVYIPAKPNNSEQKLIGFFPVKMGTFSSDQPSSKITFLSRFEKIPVSLLNAQNDFPVIAEIQTQIEGA